MSANVIKIYDAIASIILEVELELRRLNLWSEKVPDKQRLQSVEPFCIDTLDFHEWVQFVFLSRIKIIIEKNGQLPENSAIQAMAEEYLKVERRAIHIVKLFGDFDRLISNRLTH